MSTTYVVVANGSKSTLYSYKNNQKTHLSLIKTVKNHSSKQKEQDLISSDYGSYHANGKFSKFTPRVEHTIEEKKLFAKKLTDLLIKHKNEQAYDNIVLISSERFLGLLRKEFPKTLHDCIQETYQGDYTNQPKENIVTLIWGEAPKRTLRPQVRG